MVRAQRLASPSNRGLYSKFFKSYQTLEPVSIHRVNGGTASAVKNGMNLNCAKDTKLNDWLKTVNAHLSVRRTEARARPQPKRNRERERARREARQLFAQYYAERAMRLAS